MAYRLSYSDYSTTTGPPDPAAWVGPPGPMGPPGPPGPVGPPASPDVANVLDFGADPTSGIDSSAAFNAAAAQIAPSGRPKSVYVPTGWYLINNQINLAAGQALYGDSRLNSVLLIDQRFSPSAASVIYLTGGPSAAGPLIHDLGISFAQPPTALTRAGFKTLAAGGTSGSGGTGVAYPWAVAAGSGSMRVQIVRVMISGAWNGISSNNNNCVFYLEDIEMGALNVGLSLGETTGILDTTHINNYWFWPYGLTAAGPNAVFSDGQTTAVRFGRLDGLNAHGLGSFMGRIIFTSEAALGGASTISSLLLDTDATLEINTVRLLQITNLGTTAAGTALRPLIQAFSGSVQISGLNVFGAPTGSTQNLISVNGADVSISGLKMTVYNNGGIPVFIDGGILRIYGGVIYPASGAAYSTPLIYQGGSASLRATDLDLHGAAGSSGTAISSATDNQGNLIGTVLLGAGWTNSFVGTVNGVYAPWLSVGGGTMTGGLHFGSAIVTGVDLSRHIELYGGFAGINVTAGAMNLVVGGAVSLALINAGAGLSAPQLRASASFANDAAAATGGVPVGGLYRNGSAVQCRIA